MAATGLRPEDDVPRQSLQWRLPLLICGLFLVVLGAVVYAAYREVEATLEQGAGERARHAAQQVTGIFGPATAQSFAQMQRVAPALRAYLQDPGDAGLASARAALAALAPTPSRRVTVWNRAGIRVLDLPEPPSTAGGATDGAVAPPASQPSLGIGPIQVKTRPFADAAVPVPAGDGQTATLGVLSVRSALGINPPDLLSRLIGGDARILFGNQSGDVWTDMTQPVAGPPVDRGATGFQRYRAASGDDRLGAISALAGTPWVVWVEFPRSLMVASANVFLRRMALFVFLVGAGAVLLVRKFVIGVTTPLAAMTAAAEAMAAGDYSRGVATDRADEIGRLGRAFNAMRDDVARELTERKRAHDLLQEREAQLRLYALHSPVAVAMFDREMKYVVASRRWVEDYRLGDRALVGRSHYDVFPDVPQQWIDIYQRCLAGRVEKSDEDSFARADGTSTTIRWEIRPWHQADGAIGGLIVFSEDITERKEAQAALRASEGRSQTLFDYAPDGILIADPQSYYLDANPSMCRMLGLSRDAIVGLHASDIVVPGEVENIAPALRAINSRTDYHRQWQFRRRDGSVFDADVIATKMPDGNLLAMIRDVTDRNAAIQAVKTAEERMRFALESAGVGIWDVDYRSGVLRWSEILEAHYGLAPGTFEGTFDAYLERVHPDDRGSVRTSIAAAMETGADFSLQHRIVRPDGAVRWASGAGQIHLGPDGDPVRGVGISLDVTERHTLEAQFQQAQKMEAVGRLAGGVAHDFNNLLMAILGYCELLLADLTADDPRRHDIAEIQKAGTRAAGLTRQLLAFSRKQIIEPMLLDVNDVVSELQSLLRRLIAEDVAIVVALDRVSMTVTADRGQLEQVIVNLAVNARDAMPKGGTLTIETAHVDLDEDYAAAHFSVKPGPYVALTVSDTGVGITPEVQAHLFEPFFTTKEPGQGTGLGLATVHGIVSRCGGSVGVYSEVGRGTSFKVYFPRASGATGVDAPRLPSEPPRGEGQTILVVDDADELRELIFRTLQRQGYSVLLASNAAEASRQFEEQPQIDVLLTDVIMPGASGPELTIGLRERLPALKVIYMSGYTEDAIVHHGVLKSGIAFLHKPFSADALGQKIREVLGR